MIEVATDPIGIVVAKMGSAPIKSRLVMPGVVNFGCEARARQEFLVSVHQNSPGNHIDIFSGERLKRTPWNRVKPIARVQMKNISAPRNSQTFVHCVVYAAIAL